MRQRFEVIYLFVKSKKFIKKQTGRKIKVLQFDDVGKYNRNQFLQFSKKMVSVFTS